MVTSTKLEAIVLDITIFTVIKEDVIAKIDRYQVMGLYKSDYSVCKFKKAMAAAQIADINLWNKRLRHSKTKTLKYLNKSA